MARVTIVIEDTPDGKVRTIATPPAEDLLREMRKTDGRGVSPAKVYAIRALTAILKLGKETGDSAGRIITRIPKGLDP